ncbi:hypothetical protein GIW50_16715 [Pseudomonas syringae]|uniref:Uncharacterized protein n=1 Tax=Pseudomonas syringae TaxID=317 RepID=A0A9Q3X2S0_PSESX|nr:hypothetical protein [Pseudomonas syringae]MCF5064081.1 hypothetical protein [Pseudomonas syringae]MCF5074888.1 hypothetical protein [Pseudomonas syringae]MCF5120029.1 hypothetical protein [Pseudomonas syringae]MCF5379142.1 hypothetical protein [Pseudomonas syringae]
MKRPLSTLFPTMHIQFKVTNMHINSPRLDTIQFPGNQSAATSAAKQAPASAMGVEGNTQVPSPSGRPLGDRRTELEIEYDNPILNSGPLWLSNPFPPGGSASRGELLNDLKRHVGDFSLSNRDLESRADAMFNLVQVLKHIDAEPNQRGDGQLSDVSTAGQPSEQDRVREFAAKGYGVLKPLNQAPTQNTVPTAHAGLAPGDNRSLEQITANPLFKAFDAPTPSSVLKDFQKVLGGDWNNPKFPEHIRRHIAADAERVLQYIDKSVGDEPKRNNGVVEGTFHSTYKLLGETLSPEDFTLDNSPARKLVEFSQQGYRALSN